ncbi:hypothetical protein NDN08_000353 [Rhodosorus marinus]|uniref:Uncharacterized protein n=1 Tax=Rhodosorus marinus TaxID=101924 RepID=A0AAV8UMN3_9RHOD|nr:hypothetical protein NDN08_000353 [Rhodosorus marinus]
MEAFDEKGRKRSSIKAGTVSIPGVEEVVEAALFGEDEEKVVEGLGEEGDELVVPVKKVEESVFGEYRGSGGSDRASRSERTTSSSVSIPRVEDVVEAGLSGAVEDLGVTGFGEVEREVSGEGTSAKERQPGFVQERPASARVSIPKLEEVVAVGLTGAVEDLGPRGRGRVSAGRGQAFQGVKIGSASQGEEGQSYKEQGQRATRIGVGGSPGDVEHTEPVLDPVQFEDLIETGNTEEEAVGLVHGTAVRIEAESIEEYSEGEAEMEAPLEEATQAVETVAMTMLTGEDMENAGDVVEEEVVEEIVEEEDVDEEVVDAEVVDEEVVDEEVVDAEVVDEKVGDEMEEEEDVDDDEAEMPIVESEVVEAVEERTVELAQVGMEASTSVEPAEYSEDQSFSGLSNNATGTTAVEDVTTVAAEVNVVAETAASAITAEAGAVSVKAETTAVDTGAATAAADRGIESGSKLVEDDAVHEAIEEAKSAAAIAIPSAAGTPRAAPESLELTGEAKPRSSVADEVGPIEVATTATAAAATGTAPASSSEIVPAAVVSEEAREGEAEETEAHKDEDEEEEEEEDEYQTPAVRFVSIVLKLKNQVEGYVNMLKAAIAEKQGDRAVMLRSLRIAAQSGLVSCQVKLGDKLLYGQGVGVEYANPEEGAEWHLKAAEQGVIRSQLIAADCYLQGVGLEKDPAEVDRLLGALNWEKLPETINKAQLGVMCYQLSQIYLQGKIQLTKSKFRAYPKDDERCFTWTRRAAGLGNMTAVAQLASLYDQGIGCEESQELAFVNWKRAAIGGDARSALQTGIYYFEGRGVPRDSMKAVEWIKQAAKRGDAEAHLTLGEYHHDMNLYEKSLEEFRIAAEAGYAQAQYAVGWYYFYGLGVRRDFSEAVKWFYRAANQDCAEAFFYLGMCTMEGKGLVADPEEAKRLMRYGRTLNPNLAKDVERYLTDASFNEANQDAANQSATPQKRKFFPFGKSKEAERDVEVDAEEIEPEPES